MKKESFYFDSWSCSKTEPVCRVHAIRYTPDHGQIIGVVQIVHGMAEHIERYEEFAGFLTDRGFAVTGEDHLGHGKTVPLGGIYGYFCEEAPATAVVENVHLLRGLTQKLYPNVPYIMLGHSMGSFILRNYLCSYGEGLKGAIIMGTGMQPPALVQFSRLVVRVQKLFCGSKHVSRFIDMAAFGSYNNRFQPVRTKSDWLSRDKAMVDKYESDPLCGYIFTVNGFETLFELVAGIQKKKNLERIPKNLPILLLSGGDDPVGEYGKGVERAYQSLKAVGIEAIRMKLYDKYRHELLNELDRDVVMQDIYEWIRGTKIV